MDIKVLIVLQCSTSILKGIKMKIKISGEAEEIEAFLYDCQKNFITGKPTIPIRVVEKKIKEFNQKLCKDMWECNESENAKNE